jgi:esterase/lipase superfamily enzyme
MAYDLDLDAVPVFYSWPSKGQEAAYIADEDAASWTVSDLRQFLEAFADRSSNQSIYIIAHSMGSRAATRALTSLVGQRSDLAARFSEIVLAAPDIDADEFRREIAPRFAAVKEPVTLYASSRDKALAASKAIHEDEERAGQTVPHVVVVPGVETIDASAVDTSWLGHSYFVEERTLLTDMTLLLKDKLQAAKRPGLVTVPLAGSMYWAFRP